MRRSGFLAAATLVALLSVAVAAPTLRYGFVYDDEAVVLERKPFWEEGLATFVKTRHWGSGRHATLASLDLDRLWSGTVPLPFHATNIVLSALLSAAVLLLASRLGLGLAGAGAAAALFAVHPTHVDAVASIVGRAELLAALGVVGALVLAIRPLTSSPPRHLNVLVGTAVLATLAFHAKESSLCLLPLLLLARLLLGGRVAAVPALAGGGLALVTLLAVAANAAGSIETPEFVDNPLAYDSFLDRLPKAMAVLADYARLTIWPHPLLPDRSFAATDPGLSAGWIAAGAWLAIAAGVWGLRRRAPLVALAMAWFPLAFAVSGNVAFPIGTIMAERLLLLPSFAACLAAGLLVDHLAARGQARRGAIAAAVLLTVAVFFVQFRTRASVWESADTYFPASAKASPRSAKAAYDHGLYLLKQKRRSEAEAELARALAIRPAFTRASFHLAESMAARGADAEGAQVYANYLSTTPTDTGAMINLARLLLNAGKPDEALVWARRLVELAPENPDAVSTLVRAEAAAKRARQKAVREPPVSP